MPKLPAAGVFRDQAGGPIGPGPVLTVFNGGVPCVVPGTTVTTGGTITGPGSPTVFVQKLPVCRAGVDLSSSGIPIVAVGTVWVGP